MILALVMVMSWHLVDEPQGIFNMDDDGPFTHPDAACAGLPASMFFIARGESPTAAKKVCASCAVRQQCLDYALDNREAFGVWGGTTVRDRERLLGRRLTISTKKR